MKKVVLLLVLSSLVSGCRFYEVDKGKVYRSPQPTEEQLEKAIYKYGVKTVVNLRGALTHEPWYKYEKAITQKAGVLQVDIPMSAKRLPHRKDLLLLLDTFRNAPKPMLIHCMAGVDRTGEAAALYQMIYMKKSKKDAIKMLTPKFGHFETFMPAKRYFIGDVWQNERWAYDKYDPCAGGYQYYDTNDPGCLEEPAAPLSVEEDT